MDKSFEWWTFPACGYNAYYVLCTLPGPSASKWLHTHFCITSNKYVTKKITRCVSVYNYVFLLIPKYSGNPIPGNKQKHTIYKKKNIKLQCNLYMVNRMHFYMANLNCLRAPKIFTFFSTDKGLPRRILPQWDATTRSWEGCNTTADLLAFWIEYLIFCLQAKAV